MYLHLGQDTVITTDSITAMFDIDACTVSKKTRDELPRSFVVCCSGGKTTVYISQLSTKTLSRRLATAGVPSEAK